MVELKVELHGFSYYCSVALMTLSTHFLGKAVHAHETTVVVLKLTIHEGLPADDAAKALCVPGPRLKLQVTAVGTDAFIASTALGNGRVGGCGSGCGFNTGVAAEDAFVAKLLPSQHGRPTFATHKALFVKHQVSSFRADFGISNNDSSVAMTALLGFVPIVAILTVHAPFR